MRRPLVLALLLATGCAEDAPSPEPTPAPAATSTQPALADFYDAAGGRDAFPAHYVQALEALLYGQDDLAGGDRASARARVDTVWKAMPLSTPIWRQDATFGRLNVGDPIAYYGLRMLDQILQLGEQPATGSLQLTAVVAPCAAVSRPTLPDLASETVQLDIAPAILADDAEVLKLSTDLFRRWVEAITGGLRVDLVVHRMDGCTTVDFTDDGSVIVSYPDAEQMVSSVPSAIARETDMWWVIAPSGVPGDGSGYGRHFITGGMGANGAGLPVFLSDDGWFTRKPEHLGAGPYSEVELRAYQPQWFQHEFMHHLFRTWPEFELEAAPHQWFDRSTWPADFVGRWEADYYIEAVTKRLLAAEPPLAEGLTAMEVADPSELDRGLLAGSYQRLPRLNDWHDVQIVVEAGIVWSNAAGVSWGMEIRDRGLWTRADCPYGVSEVLVEVEDGAVAGLWFGGERYGRVR